jgi:response regulator RpfG family c-di-GMP phosphodiesterase
MNDPAPILVVDDEELIATALGEILRQANYDVVTMSQPLLALEELKKRDFSLIISDQRMPGLSGLELLAEARRLQPNATRILITGVLNLDTVIDAINKGEIFRFIVKPWLREEFLATVSNALQRYELLCQNSRLEASSQDITQQLQQANKSLQEITAVAARQKQQLAELNQVLENGAARSRDFHIKVLEAFCPDLGAQARCALQVCQALGSMLELSPDERAALESAACLYDAGLLRLPRRLVRTSPEILQTLPPADHELLRKHPIFSQELACCATGSDQVSQIVRAHHERFDGTGYPDGLRGEKTPWLSRLLAPAITYASSDLPAAQTIQALKAQAGSGFDPEAVRVLVKALHLAGLPSKEREVTLKDLTPGMVLARGIYSQTGVLLVPEGERLNETYINELRRYSVAHPPAQTFAVYC